MIVARIILIFSVACFLPSCIKKNPKPNGSPSSLASDQQPQGGTTNSDSAYQCQCSQYLAANGATFCSITGQLNGQFWGMGFSSQTQAFSTMGLSVSNPSACWQNGCNVIHDYLLANNSATYSSACKFGTTRANLPPLTIGTPPSNGTSTPPSVAGTFFAVQPGTLVTILHEVHFADDEIWGMFGGPSGLGRPYIESHGGYTCTLVRQNLTYDDPPSNSPNRVSMGAEERIPAQSKYKVIQSIENLSATPTGSSVPWPSSSIPWPSTKNGNTVSRAAIDKFLIVQETQSNRQFGLNCSVATEWFPQRKDEVISPNNVTHLVQFQ